MPKRPCPPRTAQNSSGSLCGGDPVADLPVGGHQLDRGHVVGREAVAPGEVAHATAERVADHADARRRSRQRRQPVGDGGVDDRPPATPRPPPARVRPTGSTRTPCIRLVVTSTAPSTGAAAPCPVAWTATGRPLSRAYRTAAATSARCSAATTTDGPVGDRRVEPCRLGGSRRVVAVEDRPGHLARESIARA